WHAERSDSQLAIVVREGKLGTPMPSTRYLTPGEVQSVVAYLRTLPMRQKQLASKTEGSNGSADAVGRRAVSILDQALNAARNGQRADASARGRDAYMASEPIETRAKARSPGVVSSMERLFAEFRGAINGNDIRGAERVRDAIEASMPKIVELTQP